MPRIRKSKSLEAGGKAKVIGTKGFWHAYRIGSIVELLCRRESDTFECKGISKTSGNTCFQTVDIVDLQSI